MSVPPSSVAGMLIDCTSCSVRDIACGDCVVTALLGPAEVTPGQSAALAVLSASGLVSPLRMVPTAGAGSAGAALPEGAVSPEPVRRARLGKGRPARSA